MKKKIFGSLLAFLTPLVAVVFFQNCSSAFRPAQNRDLSSNGIFQINEKQIQMFDMVMDVSDFGLSDPKRRSHSLNAATDFRYYNGQLWTNATVPVVFSATISADKQALFYSACKQWEDGSGVKCRPRQNEKKYLFIDNKPGDGPNSWNCWTEVGMGTGSDVKQFNFEDKCWYMSAVRHDIGHVFGLIHEQQRKDRDSYITINFDDPGIQAQKGAYAVINTSTLNSPYDFVSVMHYPFTAFMQPKAQYAEYAKTCGYCDKLSEFDKLSMAALYGTRPGAIEISLSQKILIENSPEEPNARLSAYQWGYYFNEVVGKSAPHPSTYGISPDADPSFSSAEWFDLLIRNNLLKIIDDTGTLKQTVVLAKGDGQKFQNQAKDALAQKPSARAQNQYNYGVDLMSWGDKRLTAADSLGSPTGDADYNAALNYYRQAKDLFQSAINMIQEDYAVPVINSFVANQTQITPGTETYLTWSTSNAASVAITGPSWSMDRADLNGALAVSPTQTFTYVLTAKNATQTSTVTKSVTVTVVAVAQGPLFSFTSISPTSAIYVGESVTISWASTNASHIEIDGVSGQHPSAGSVQVTPATTTSYRMVAYGATGMAPAVEYVTVVVKQLPNPVITASFKAGYDSVFNQSYATLKGTSFSIGQDNEVWSNCAGFEKTYDREDGEAGSTLRQINVRVTAIGPVFKCNFKMKRPNETVWSNQVEVELAGPSAPGPTPVPTCKLTANISTVYNYAGASGATQITYTRSGTAVGDFYWGANGQTPFLQGNLGAIDSSEPVTYIGTPANTYSIVSYVKTANSGNVSCGTMAIVVVGAPQPSPTPVPFCNLTATPNAVYNYASASPTDVMFTRNSNVNGEFYWGANGATPFLQASLNGMNSSGPISYIDIPSGIYVITSYVKTLTQGNIPCGTFNLNVIGPTCTLSANTSVVYNYVGAPGSTDVRYTRGGTAVGEFYWGANGATPFLQADLNAPNVSNSFPYIGTPANTYSISSYVKTSKLGNIQCNAISLQVKDAP